MSAAVREPYIFISYAHADAARLSPLIAAMRAHGYRVWYDGDITAGSEWTNAIASHLRDSAVFLAFVSPHSAASENCLDEMAYAKSCKKPALLIFTNRGVQLPEGAEMQTARYQRLFLQESDTPADFLRALDGVPLLDSCREEPEQEEIPVQAEEETPPAPRRNKWLLAILLTLPELFLTLAVLLVLQWYGAFTPPAPADTVPTGMDARADALITDTVYIDGVAYTLPVPLSAFLEDGWAPVMGGYWGPSKTVWGHGSDSVLLSKGQTQLIARYYNPSGHAAEASDCAVVRLSGSTDTIGDMTLESGIDLKALSVRQLTETYGPPASYTYDEEDAEHCLFYGDTATDAGLSFWYKAPDAAAPTLLMIEVAKVSAETENAPSPPAYLATYTPPEALGEDLLSGVFELEGSLYRLGVPVSVLLADGWTLQEGSPVCLVAGEEAVAWLTRDGKTLQVRLRNDSRYQTATENGYVLALGLFGGNDEPSLRLPCGLTAGMPEAAADALLSNKSIKLPGEGYVTYELPGPSNSLSVTVDTRTGVVSDVLLASTVPIY